MQTKVRINTALLMFITSKGLSKYTISPHSYARTRRRKNEDTLPFLSTLADVTWVSSREPDSKTTPISKAVEEAIQRPGPQDICIQLNEDGRNPFTSRMPAARLKLAPPIHACLIGVHLLCCFDHDAHKKLSSSGQTPERPLACKYRRRGRLS